MTSLELVDYINSVRKEDADRAGAPFPSKGFAKLEHSDFMKKVPLVLGKEAARKFSGTDFYINGTGAKVSRDIYTFPKREACLMAMSMVMAYSLVGRPPCGLFPESEKTS
jgi:hypothetical protein